jgi:hypothetical protein
MTLPYPHGEAWRIRAGSHWFLNLNPWVIHPRLSISPFCQDTNSSVLALHRSEVLHAPPGYLRHVCCHANFGPESLLEALPNGRVSENRWKSGPTHPFAARTSGLRWYRLSFWSYSDWQSSTVLHYHQHKTRGGKQNLPKLLLAVGCLWALIPDWNDFNYCDNRTALQAAGQSRFQTCSLNPFDACRILSYHVASSCDPVFPAAYLYMLGVFSPCFSEAAFHICRSSMSFKCPTARTNSCSLERAQTWSTHIKMHQPGSGDGQCL